MQCRLLFADDTAQTLLAKLSPKYKPAFNRLGSEEQQSTALYFLPHSSQKPTLSVTRPRVIKWYCPFADQTTFPSGVRYSINVYSGCEHGCRYCYVQGYSAANIADVSAKCKDRFREQFLKDLADIEKFNVPCTPAHLSNSTDAFGPIEEKNRNSLFVLEQLLLHRHRFSTITLLTKNPAALLHSHYLQTLIELTRLATTHPLYHFFQENHLPPLWVEVSLAFWNEESRKMFEPGTPSVADRLSAMTELQRTGVPVALRIDPLFPRDPLGRGKSMCDFDLFDIQSCDDLRQLVSFCKRTEIAKIIYSPLKITKPRTGSLPSLMSTIKRIYEHLSSGRPLEFRGGSWRLPPDVVQKKLFAPLLEMCQEAGIVAKGCKENLIGTP